MNVYHGNGYENGTSRTHRPIEQFQITLASPLIRKISLAAYLDYFRCSEKATHSERRHKILVFDSLLLSCTFSPKYYY